MKSRQTAHGARPDRPELILLTPLAAWRNAARCSACVGCHNWESQPGPDLRWLRHGVRSAKARRRCRRI